MALRSFQDERGRTWQVWNVQPPGENVFAGGSASSDPAAGRRPHRQRLSVALDPQWASGWLAFETPGEKRRLAPCPTDWTGFSEHELMELCAKALLVRPSRAAPSA